MTSKVILKEVKLLKRQVTFLKKEIKQRNLFRKKYLKTDEVAKIMGVSKSQVQKLTASKKIPHSKPTGKLIYIQRKDLYHFLSSNYISSNEELNSRVADFIINTTRK